MSEAEFPISPATAARLAREAFPQLALFSKPTIDGDEQAQLYAAQRAGHDLPRSMACWMFLTEPAPRPDEFQRDRVITGIRCPGCQHEMRRPRAAAIKGEASDFLEPGPRACDGCGRVSLVPF